LRIIKTLLSSIIIFVVLGGIGFFAVREVLTQMAVSQLKASVSKMRQIAANTGAYTQECRLKGVTQGRAIEMIQLRFTSDTEYFVEVVCSNFSLSPIQVSQKSLPPLVTKVPGNSGLVWQELPTSLGVQLWGRTLQVGVTDFQLVTGSSVQTIQPVRPITSCQGYGFECCQIETAQGEGALVSDAADCPRTCYSSCVARPVILSVTTQPFLDQKTRTVTLKAGEEVEVGYVLDAAVLEGLRVTIDFGDGEQQRFSDINDRTAHVYKCGGGNCQYQLTVSAVDGAGIMSAATPITKINVVVK
jgi:hypothetical protein